MQLFAAFLLANEQVLKEVSRNAGFQYQVGSVVLSASALTVAGGIALSCLLQGARLGLHRCLDLRRIRRCALPSALLACAHIIQFSGLRYISADALVLTELVLGLVLSACGAWALRGRTLSWVEMSLLVSALLGLLAFLSEDKDLTGSQLLLHGQSVKGWLCALASAALYTSAGLVSETVWDLREGCGAAREGKKAFTALLAQKTQQGIPALSVALFYCIACEPAFCPDSPSVRQGQHVGQIFQGWDGWTVAVLCAALASSWLVSGAAGDRDEPGAPWGQARARSVAVFLVFLELELFVGSQTLRVGGRQQGLRALVGLVVALGCCGALTTLTEDFGGARTSRRTWSSPSEETAALAEPLLGSLPEQAQPEDSALRRLAQVLRSRGIAAILCVLYILADAGKMFLVVWANDGRVSGNSFLPSSLLLVQLCISGSIAVGISVWKVGIPHLCQSMHPKNVARCMPVSALFFLSKSSTIAALWYVDAGTVKLSTELILPCTVFLSVMLIKGSTYSNEQWVSIITICVGTLAFQAVQMEAAQREVAATKGDFSHQRAQWATGLAFCAVIVLANSLGSVVGERFLKGSKDIPLTSLKAQLVTAELVVISLYYKFYEGPRHGTSWFAGWDWRVLVCALGWVPSTWMSTIITARFSSVVKNVLQCFSTLFTYFVTIWQGKTHNLGATLSALLVVMSIVNLILQKQAEDAAAASAESDLEETDEGMEWVREYTEATHKRLPSRGKAHAHMIRHSPRRRRSQSCTLPAQSWHRIEDVLDLAVLAENREPLSGSGSSSHLPEVPKWPTGPAGAIRSSGLVAAARQLLGWRCNGSAAADPSNVAIATSSSINFLNLIDTAFERCTTV